MSKRKKRAPSQGRASLPDSTPPPVELLGAASEEQVPELLLGAPGDVPELEDVLAPPPEPQPSKLQPSGEGDPLVKAQAVEQGAPPPAPVDTAPSPPETTKKRLPRAFPVLPPDITKAPPPLTKGAQAEELPAGAPRGLDDLPAPVAVIPQELPARRAAPVDPALQAARERARDHSLWDAAETGEAFPTTRQVIQALLWSVGTGLVGFAISFIFFVKHESIANVPRIDRRAAETAPPLAYRSNPDAPSITFAGYAGGSLSDPPEPRRPNARLKVRPAETPTPQAPPKPTPTPTAVNSDNQKAYPQETPKHVAHQIAAPKNNNPVAAPVAARPSSKGWVPAWQEAREAVVRLFTAEGPNSLGVIVSKEGLVVTCLSRLPADLSRLMTHRGLVSATIVGRLPECDVALLQLPPGGYSFIPLCPDSPRTGEWLISPNASEPSRQCQQQCCGALSGGTFRVRGAAFSGSAGAPLINDRAELVGIALGHPWLFSGNQQVAASANRLNRLVASAGKEGGGGSARTCNDFFLEYLGSIAAITNRTRPTDSNAKVMAGDSMGNYPIGLTSSDLLAECGQPSHSDEQDGIQRLEFSTQRIVCLTARDRVVAIETDYSFFSAGRGLSVGSPADSSRFLSEYPGAMWVENGQHALGVAPGIELECQSGKISKIRVVPK